MKSKTKTNSVKPLSGLRKRIQHSGNIYYYFEEPRVRPRKEIPLGSDYAHALATRARLILNIEHFKSIGSEGFEAVSEVYLQAILPLREPLVQAEQKKSIERLRKFFSANHLTWSQDTIEENRHAYFQSRGENARIRARREWSLLSVIHRLVSEL